MQKLGVMLLCILVSSGAQAQPSPERRTPWVERPWEFRYVISIQRLRSFERVASEWAKAAADPKASYRQDYEGLVAPQEVVSLPPYELADPLTYRKWGRLVIEFDRSGLVLTPHSGPQGLRGHLNRIQTLLLASGSELTDWEFHLGQYYMGRSGDDLPFVPAICHYVNEFPGTSGTDTLYRYGKDFSPGPFTSRFGCREWGYYLQSAEHPYIDISSYEQEDDTDKPKKRGKHPKRTVAYIRPTTGWGRFDVPPKPVIGKHIDTWVCFHECPNGDAPGIIPDIKAWAAKNGWPEPKVPKKMPLFPDKPYKPGELVD